MGLLARHCAFIAFSLSIVSFIFDGLAVVAAGAGAAGAVVWADATWSPTASSAAARQILVQNIEIPHPKSVR
ncbi:hypothetical protein JCM18382A_03670 [Bradyrhizobium sp. 17-4]